MRVSLVRHKKVVALGGIAAVLGASLVTAAVTSSTASAASATFTGTNPVVRTDDGRVRGTMKARYVEFKGIPYAAPPVDDLRWKAPREPESWQGVRDASSPGGSCTQGSGWDPGYEQPTYNEDCLYLNVYAPADAKGKLPVMFWIHGGGNRGGAGIDTYPARFVDEAQAVYVTINYRLGALGYLRTPGLDAESSADGSAGNYGILDQQMALRWVRDNIESFGGDPKRVTVAGQSAGASNTCAQLVSPAARGLFHRAILQSGGCSSRSVASAESDGAGFATRLGCTDAATQLACLRGKTPAEIFAAQGNFPGGNVADGKVIPLDAREALRQDKIAQVPVIIGNNADESQQSVFGANDYLGKPLTEEAYAALVRSNYGANADKVLAEYEADDFASPTVAWGTVQSDARSCRDQVIFREFAAAVPTWAYEFAERDGPAFTSIWRLGTDYPFGATHVNELGYLWDYLGTHLPFSNAQEDLSDLMTTYWGTFVAKGEPNSRTTPTWQQLRASNALMQFSAESSRMISLRTHGAAHNCALWAPIV